MDEQPTRSGPKTSSEAESGVGPAPASPSHSPSYSPSRGQRAKDYWQANIRAVLILLLIWAAVSYGCGILFVDQLNKVNLPGSSFPLGFWFAQQGSIVVFVGLIAVYALWLRRLDQRFGLSGDKGAA